MTAIGDEHKSTAFVQAESSTCIKLGGERTGDCGNRLDQGQGRFTFELFKTFTILGCVVDFFDKLFVHVEYGDLRLEFMTLA